MSKIVVLDYGSSNLRSVAKALETVAEGNHKITVTDKPKVILNADKVVFPGQGMYVGYPRLRSPAVGNMCPLNL